MSDEKLSLPMPEPSDFPVGTVLTIDIPLANDGKTAYHRIAMIVEIDEGRRGWRITQSDPLKDTQ